MRPALAPDGPLERLALASGLLPEGLILQSLCMGYARCLGAAVRLGVFEALARGPRPAAEVAAEIGADPLGTTLLLRALAGLTLLRQRGDRFSLPRSTRRWLLASSPESLRDASLFLADLWDRWGTLEEVLRTGRVGDFHAPGQDPGFWQRYLRGLACFARMGRGEVARKAALPREARRALDIGGGHGVYAVGLCERHPELTVEVLDLPEACAVGREVVRSLGFEARVHHREGDHRQDALGEGWDAVLIFNVLHNETPEGARALLRRATAALRPGGALLVLEGEHQEPRGSPTAVAGLNEIFFYLLNGTQVWPEATLRAWMEEAGLHQTRAKRLLRAPAVLLRGERPR